MPASPIALAAPLYELRDLVGAGWPSDSPAVTALDGAHTALSDIAAALGRSWDDAAGGWAGASATAAAGFTADTAAQVAGLAEQAQALSTAARDADSAVARARSLLQAIIDRFEERAAALAPHLDEPGVAEELHAEARRAIAEASAVVDELRADLDHRAEVSLRSDHRPARFPGRLRLLCRLRRFPHRLLRGSPGVHRLLPRRAVGVVIARKPPVGLRDPGMFGDGVAVRLPDGSTAVAPNAVAASAVRHALTQLGVPYRWGGTTPGVGLDCSGLTQWAYHEAGLDLPRLAQEQDVGTAVSPGTLRPGDLAVWDGHVAMIVGANTMIEAGDPVKLSPIRTTNAGQGFQGFWRPTV